MKQKRHNRMKLTKTQLRQIIREEIQSLNEGISQGDLELTRDGKLNYAGKTIDGDFNCSFNSLKTLEGAPKSVGGGFYCNDNKLTSLEGAPKTVGGGFYCYNNDLKSLKGAPTIVKRNFNCTFNSLTTLKGAPKSVGGDFYCYNNNLKSLEGIVGLRCNTLILPKSILAKNGGLIKGILMLKANYKVKAKSIRFK